MGHICYLVEGPSNVPAVFTGIVFVCNYYYLLVLLMLLLNVQLTNHLGFEPGVQGTAFLRGSRDSLRYHCLKFWWI